MPELLRPASLTLFPSGDDGRDLMIECGERHARTTVIEAELTHEYRHAVMLIFASIGIAPVALCMENAIGKSKGDISLVSFDEEQNRLVLLDPEPISWPRWGDRCPNDYFVWGYWGSDGSRVQMAFRIEGQWEIDYEQVIKDFAGRGKVIIKEAI